MNLITSILVGVVIALFLQVIVLTVALAELAKQINMLWYAIHIERLLRNQK